MNKFSLYDAFYQYSHFFLTFYSMLLIFFSILSLILGFWLGLFINYYYLSFFLIFLVIFPYGLDMFSRGIYNYPLFIMFVIKEDRWQNKIYFFLYKYVKFCFFLNAFLFFMLCIFEFLILGHFIIFYEISIGLKMYGMICLITLIQCPVMLEIFYYGWANKSLYYVPTYELNQNIG